MELDLEPQIKISRHLVLAGEDLELSRRNGKNVAAMSECIFRCKSVEARDRCIAAIKESDEHLRNRPAQAALWDWKSTWIETGNPNMENCVMLGVAWYDYDFFLEKKDVYLDFSHLEIFNKIGLEQKDIDVIHWIRKN